MSGFAERRDYRVFEDWLQAYGHAWEAQDSAAFAARFADHCRYYWSPFVPVIEGPDAVADAFNEAIAKQNNIRFRYTVIDWSDRTGTSHWQCSFARADGTEVIIDGILRAILDDDDLCEEFHEWWHSNED